VLCGVAEPAGAIDFWDGRIEVHGFYETRMSFGYEDFNSANGIDMYGWLQVLNLEAEADIAPDGWGPFDMVSAFARVEVKYDCVWNHACGVFESVDAFGNDPGNLPHRVQNTRRQGIAASQVTFDERPYWFGDRQRLAPGLFEDTEAGQRTARSIVYGYTSVGLFGSSPGPDGVLGDMRDIRDGDPFSGLPGDDDAGLYLFERTSSCKVGNWGRKDSSRRGYQSRELLWSIDGCEIEPLGFNRGVANPFADEANSAFGGDKNPVLVAIGDPDGIPNATALPFRPGAEFMALPHNQIDRAGGQEPWHSQGLFVPNLAVRKAIRSGEFGDFDQNFSENELQWNRGASQQTLKELRELYFDVELFESRLWLRAGKQTIVWGKTEIFRNQDQWNPVDIAIGPLSSLEESRIALWALRGVWSFYEVGPLEDVRTELVVLYDQFEPTDIGRCGEPYVPRVACDKSFGLWVHGQNGTGIAGEIRPEDPWSSSSGIEVGGRLEFRWERFSFAFSDYWGYNDSAHASILFQYDRNVDPVSGRARHTDTRGPCQSGNPALEPDCLAPGNPLGGVVAIHSINQSMFAWVCAGTVGVAPTVDAAACAFTLFNSTNPISTNPAFANTRFMETFSQILAGSGAGRSRYGLIVGDSPPAPPKIADALNQHFGPGGTISDNTLFAPNTPLVALAPGNETGLSAVLSPEQQAFYGCGPFYSTVCNEQGVDLANSEASVILQSFPWFEGTLFDSSWDTADASLPQPGTVDAVFNDGDGGGADAPFSKPGGLETGPAGTRYEDIDGDGDKELVVLPGARFDPAAFADVLANAAANDITVDPYVLANLAQYDPTVDGTTTVAGNPTHHPFTGQLWSSKMAVSSWNFLMLAAGLGAADNAPSRGTLDRNQPLALGRCSYRQPQFCTFVSGLASQSRNTSASTRAGGNGRFGRRNFVWASVGDLALRYQKRNILGFSTDFAEDTTKSSWGVEFTHVNDSLSADNNEYDGFSHVDEFNLTLSVDRPTFINFLNANRTFFLNSQLFTSYIGDYRNGMIREGPWTFLWLLNANTGYYQDRFLVSAIVVFDLKSGSGGFLPTVQYRFTENFSITVGANVFAGGFSSRKMGVNQFSAFDEDNLKSTVYVENGISPVRDLDSFFTRIRYTF
jgi:hypothetical protein